MKKILIIIALIATTFPGSTYAQDSTKSPSSQLLSHYYSLSDALVVGNADQASSHAAAFVKTAGSSTLESGNDDNVKKLLKDAGNISQTKDLKKQREYFASFSVNMATLAKAVKPGDQPIYQAYCPMKKAYWLTSEKTIKNPYYGSSMLTCGTISETIQ